MRVCGTHARPTAQWAWPYLSAQCILAVQRAAQISILAEKDCTICGQWHTHMSLLWRAVHCIALYSSNAQAYALIAFSLHA